jgi:hypothetical protein
MPEWTRRAGQPGPSQLPAAAEVRLQQPGPPAEKSFPQAIRPASASHTWELPSITCTQGGQDVLAGLGCGLVPETFAGVQRDDGPLGMWGRSWKPG